MASRLTLLSLFAAVSLGTGCTPPSSARGEGETGTETEDSEAEGEGEGPGPGDEGDGSGDESGRAAEDDSTGEEESTGNDSTGGEESTGNDSTGGEESTGNDSTEGEDSTDTLDAESESTTTGEACEAVCGDTELCLDGECRLADDDITYAIGVESWEWAGCEDLGDYRFVFEDSWDWWGAASDTFFDPCGAGPLSVGFEFTLSASERSDPELGLWATLSVLQGGGDDWAVLGNTSWTEPALEGGYPSNVALAAGEETVALFGGALTLTFTPVAW